MEEQLSVIKGLSNQLLNMGYHQFQIDSILRDSIGTNNLNSISATNAQQAIEDLQEYIEFARKCGKKKK